SIQGRKEEVEIGSYSLSSLQLKTKILGKYVTGYTRIPRRRNVSFNPHMKRRSFVCFNRYVPLPAGQI
ncbi:MAG: hypothetical protein JO327_01140, partial [Nitrososphaeraceae archaeon]|nr:hypothetical protein [Nitrososphaeraceae archaeon]